jgi:hypothetical protein
MKVADKRITISEVIKINPTEEFIFGVNIGTDPEEIFFSSITFKNMVPVVNKQGEEYRDVDLSN